ncbi:MAG: TldD/PmbA family protein [Candidatus Acidulodesulfobacterium ferriphilum]|uniref:TldD/PmbA family protein n=1 Tax=Candidatus Acidulodesulfobacterium ferriphilum TaxID=2597223 RepID=A0A519BAQ9_9DELT|nr:MAG: TldD/PmbA family protein [Candidatus Acidulodesulfobacterium ferriphilum]
MNFDDVISLIDDYSRKKGIKYVVYLFNSKVLKMESENSSISNFINAEINGFNLRLLNNKRMSFSYCLGLEEQKIRDTFDNGLSLLSFMEENEYADLAPSLHESAAVQAPDFEEKLGIYSSKSDKIDMDKKKGCLIEMEETAYSYDKKIYKVDKPTYHESLTAKRICNSNGLNLSSRKTSYEVFLSVAARQGADTGSGFDFDFSHEFDKLQFKKVSMNAAKRGVDQLGARVISSGSYNILFDNFTASEFLGILKQSFYANNVYKKKSILRGKLGQKVFSSKLNIIDDGLLPGGWATDIFDYDGINMQRKPLCINGVINSFLYDIEYANRFNTKSTGNSAMQSHTLPPEVGSTNFFIENGETPLVDIILSMKEGMYINELMGLHMAKPYTGEFSLGASGFYIKNGKIEFPVKGIVVSGNLLHLFNSITGIANDIRFFGSTGSPSILFENVEVSGK